MGLVDDHANNFPYVAPTGIDVIVDRLGRTEEEAPLLPVPGPIVFIDGVAHNLGGMLRRDAHNVEARRKLLRHERFGRGAEHDLPRREPSVVVVHGRCSDERLAKSGGERHQRVVVDGRLRRLELVVSHRMVGIVGVDPGLDGLLVDRQRRASDAGPPASSEAAARTARPSGEPAVASLPRPRCATHHFVFPSSGCVRLARHVRCDAMCVRLARHVACGGVPASLDTSCAM